MEEKKIKIGGQEKVEVAEANLKGLVSWKLSSFEEKPELLGSSTIREMLSYNTKLFCMIQLKEYQKLKEDYEKAAYPP